jgi:membrane protein implicated in regulation of membrane protease activity
MPTITIPIEDVVFVVCALLGGGLLLITVLVDDVLGGVLDALHIGFDIGGVSLMPPLVAFVAMFGVGGIIATQTFDVHGGQAALIGTGFGAVGFGLALGLFRMFRKAEGTRPFSLQDLVGTEAAVSTAIPAGRHGSVYVRAEGQTHEISATSSTEVAAGTIVKVTGVAGTALMVAPVAPAVATPTEPQPPIEPPSEAS